MWLRIRGGGEQSKPHSSQFISICIAEAVGVFGHIDGFPDGMGIVSVDVWSSLSFIEFIAMFGVNGVLDYGWVLVL